uniref:ubiquitinyl hydrolase 1 n=1 Tax=Trichuris muris TaxID=70415 RepID=A0A5S6R4C4_TRIMR
MGEVFFEKQDGMLCAQHALNNLLQAPYFSAVDLAEIARKLDERERAVLGVVDSGMSLNVNDDGFFSVQVISEALTVFNLSMVSLTEAQAMNIRLELCSAFICHFESHWFTIRRIGGRWFNLNSLSSNPAVISDSHLELFLAQLTAEGCTVFLVQGLLPHCPADDVINGDDIAAVSVDSTSVRPITSSSAVHDASNNDDDEGYLKALAASLEAVDCKDASLQKALLESRHMTTEPISHDNASANGHKVCYALPTGQMLSDNVAKTGGDQRDPVPMADDSDGVVMWFEARRQERKIRTIMVDHKKRAERRRFYYERIRKDPTEFMQVHGQTCKVYFDCQVADSSSILRPWQGDPAVLIDRFDARSYLDLLPEVRKDGNCSKTSSLEERKINYERYRLLVINDFEKIPEERFLRQIYMEERFGSSTQVHSKRDEGKKKHRPTAAIGYTYEDSSDPVNSYRQFMKSTSGSGKEGHWREKTEECNLSSDEEDEEEFDVRLDVSQLTNEDLHELNRIATRYGMKMGDFTKFLTVDEQERDHLQSLKELEDQRATLSGKHSRRERKRLKDICRSSRGDFGVPLEMLRKVEPPSKLEKSSESSSSESDDANENAITYITSFDGDMKTEVKKKPKSKSRSSSYAHRRDANSPVRRNCRRRSPSYSATDSRGGHKRARRYSSLSSSSSPDRPRQYSRRRRRSSSSSASSSSSSSSCSRRSDKRSSLNSDTEVKSDKQNETEPQSDGASVLSQLSIRSSMSDSEQERRQVENTKRRLKRTKRELMKRQVPTASVTKSHGRSASKNRPSAVELLKLQTQRALKKIVARGMEESKMKREEQRRERIEREEEFRELSFRRRQELDKRSRSVYDAELTPEELKGKRSRSYKSSYRRRENWSNSDVSSS